MPFASAPLAVTRWVEGELGSWLGSTVDASGGMSPGPAARVVARSVIRAFVTACGSALNPDTLGLLRAEISVLSALPTLPRLLGSFDDGDWVALLLEDIDAPLDELP